jgi:hypothetical protein
VILTGRNFIFGKAPSACLNIFASEVTDSMHLNWLASATRHCMALHMYRDLQINC